MTRARILVVEDDPGIQDLICETLPPEQYEIFVVGTQDAAFDALATRSFHAMLLDLRLPASADSMEQSRDVGLETLKRLRARGVAKSGTGENLPVVVMTAFGSEEIAVQVLRLPGVDYLRKPFRGRALLRTIEDASFGSGAFAPGVPRHGRLIRIALHPGVRAAQIETLPAVRGTNFKILFMLAERFQADLEGRRDPPSYRKLRAAEIAERLGITEAAVFQQVKRFRRRLARDFRQHLLRAVDDNEVIENRRDWGGYRLNPVTVRLVGTDTLPVR